MGLHSAIAIVELTFCATLHLFAAIAKALDSMGGTIEKMFEIWHAGLLFYSLATWGLALAGSVFVDLFIVSKMIVISFFLDTSCLVRNSIPDRRIYFSELLSL